MLYCNFSFCLLLRIYTYHIIVSITMRLACYILINTHFLMFSINFNNRFVILFITTCFRIKLLIHTTFNIIIFQRINMKQCCIEVLYISYINNSILQLCCQFYFYSYTTHTIYHDIYN